MDSQRSEYLRKTPQEILQSELMQRLKTALEDLPVEARRAHLALQVLEIRIKKPALLTSRWRETVELWYKLIKIAPAVSHILSEYDSEFQSRQTMLLNAINSDLKAAR